MNSRVVCSECGEVEEVAVYCGNPDCGEALDDEGQAIPEVVSLREWQNGAQRVSELEGDLAALACPGCNAIPRAGMISDDFVRGQARLHCPTCDRYARVTWDHVDRVTELEGALDDALAEIRVLRAWKERAFHILRECGLQAREILLLVEPETPAPSQADPVDNPGGKL